MSDTDTNTDAADAPKQSATAIAAQGTAVPFSLAQQGEFTRKELRETLRDRRTIITLMAMPLLLYPMLGLGLRFLSFQGAPASQIEYRVAIESEAEALWFSETLQLGDRLLAASVTTKDQASTPDIQLLLPNDPAEFDPESLVRESAADVGIRIELAEANSGDQSFTTARVQLFQSRDSSLSRDAADYVQQRLEAASREEMRLRSEQRGETFHIPIEQVRELVTPIETAPAVLGLLPLILLLMTVTGGVYPAIDLTAGERERNTLETLMALPVPRFRLLLAKFVAVVSVTMLTGLMNLVAMGFTLYALQLDKTLLGGEGFTIALGLKLFLALAAFALFYSAVLLLLTSSARSFKEAQAYLIPLLLLSIAPGLVILMPGWDLASSTAALPLVNMLLLSRGLLEGTASLLPAMVAIVSTVFYGVAALAMAAQVFGNDAVATGSRGRWADLFQRPSVSASQPSITTAMVGLALLFPAYFFASGILARGDAQPSMRLGLSAVMTIALFAGVPWLLLSWQRITPWSGFGFKRTSWFFYVAACLLGIATWPWIFELVVVAQGMGIRGIDMSKIENVERLLEGWKEVPLWLVVLCLGIVPGVCEECFFRGYLFNGLKLHLGATWTIVVSAVVFGLFHVVLSGGAAPERLLPSTLMGLLLGWVAYRSGSIIPSIVLHAIHNSTLLIMVQSRDLLAKRSIGDVEQVHLPWLWLVTSAIVFLIAVLIVAYSKHNTRSFDRGTF